MISETGPLKQPRNDVTQLKPLKVRLPLERVLQLHRMRIVGGQSVSDIVTQALEEYMDGLARAHQKEQAMEP